jgi:hypothetical protein
MQPFYFEVSVQPGAGEGGEWTVKQVSKHFFVYGTEEGQKTGDPLEHDSPLVYHHILPALPV